MRPSRLAALFAACAALALAPQPAAAVDVGDEGRARDWDEFQSRNAAECVGPGEALLKPQVRTHAGYEYTFDGYKVKVRRTKGAASDEIRFGVVSGIKELDSATRRAMEGYFEKFKKAKVTALVVGGDSGQDQATLRKVFEWIARFDLPTFVVAGNWETVEDYNQALRELSKERPNLINMDLARLVDLEGVDLVGMGGYLDRNYVKGKGGCVYPKEAAESIATLAAEATDPVLLVSHGPPRLEGADAIDFVPGTGNVGDAEITLAMEKAGIHFGIFGHILEAGARASTEKGEAVEPGELSKSLLLNPGPATTRPWKLSAGGTSHGMAAILTVAGRRASWEPLKAAKPADD